MRAAFGVITTFEFIAFLNSLARRYPGRELHLICDNYGTHKHSAVKQWLAAHPRIHLHFTPTGASWLNLVERWFAPDCRSGHPARQFRQHSTVGGRDHQLARSLEPERQAVPLDKSAADMKRSLKDAALIYET